MNRTGPVALRLMVDPRVRTFFRVIILCLIAAMTGDASAQDWHWQNPLPQGNTVRDFFFADETVGWLVGNFGTILHTTNSGFTWTPQMSGTTFALRSVHFTDLNNGWVVGNGGTMLHTTNGGDSWVVEPVGTTQTLYSLVFISADSGWAVGDGGTVIGTNDGGLTWSGQTSGTTQNLNSVAFADARTGWAVGAAGTVLHTVNSGITWTVQTSGSTTSLQSVSFANTNEGWISGLSGTVLHTTNGGASWTAQAAGTTADLYSVDFTNPSEGWIAGSSGTILYTTNGGVSWILQSSGSGERLEAIVSVSPDRAWAGGTAGTILTTSDGGMTWGSQTFGTIWGLLSVSFCDSASGWAVGLAGTIQHTVDGGSIWSSQPSLTERRLRSVTGLEPTTAWAVGDSGLVLHTTNGGIVWTPQASGTTEDLYSVTFTDSDTGWIAGNAGTLLHTTDGGLSWTRETSGITDSLRAFCFVDGSTLWTVGTAGTILHTANKGETWIRQTSGTTSNLLSVFFADPETGWVTGESGTIRHTTDGGVSWSAQASGTTLPLSSVTFNDANIGWITGGLGLILRTTDGGAVWTPQVSGTTQWQFSSSFLDGVTGWTSGQEGSILHTTTGGTGQIPPPPPGLLSPPDSGLVPTQPLVTWESVPGALRYTLQVSRTPSFRIKVLNKSNLADPSYILNELDENASYYWRVCVITASNSSRWSAVRSFRTGSVPDSILLVEPLNGAVIGADTLRMVWHEGQPEVDRYWLEIGMDSLFADAIVDSTITDTTDLVVELHHFTNYWWRVRGHNPVGWGEFSEVRSFFAYFNPLPPPTLLEPANGAMNQRLEVPLVWQPVSPVIDAPDSVLYHLQLATDAGFGNLLVNDSTLVDTVTQVVGLQEETAYFWRVRARDLFSTSPWSDSWRFETLPPLPANVGLLTPAEGATVLSDSLRFVWERGEPTIDHYWIEVATDSTFTSSSSDSSLVDTTTVVHGLRHHVTYYWRVRAHNPAGWGPSGTARTFFVLVNTPETPALFAPPDDATNLTIPVTFTWGAVKQLTFQGKKPPSRSRTWSPGVFREEEPSGILRSDTLWYHLQVATDDGFVVRVLEDSTLVDTSATVNTLSDSTEYFWRVRARNLVGPGSWSDTWSLTTLGIPSAVVLSSPEDGSVVGDTVALCRWLAGDPLLDRYWFEWGEDPTFGVSVIDSMVTDTVFNAGPLGNGGTYFWRVRGHNALGWGRFSNVWSFSALIADVDPEPAIPAVFSLSQNYPNPFNPATSIKYSVPTGSEVTLKVYDTLGREVATLVNGFVTAGNHQVTFDAASLASGMYVYRLTAGGFTESRKLVLMK